MIDPDVHRNQRLVSRRREQGKTPAGYGGEKRVLCACGTCLRCRKRAWMRAARKRLHPGYWKH